MVGIKHVIVNNVYRTHFMSSWCRTRKSASWPMQIKNYQGFGQDNNDLWISIAMFLMLLSIVLDN